MTDKLTLVDCRKAGFCASGVRRRCHDLGYDPKLMFKSGGIPLSEFVGVDDSQLEIAIANAQARIALEVKP